MVFYRVITRLIFKSLQIETASMAEDSAVQAAQDQLAQTSLGEEPIYTSESRGSDELGEGTFKVPYKTIMQAMLRYGKEPFPVIYQDPKPDSDAAKEGNLSRVYIVSWV